MKVLEDWKNNLAQGGNFHSSYYKNAVKIGTKIERSGAQIHIVGHSLGGGTASAASRASGMPATTFNSAGLHRKTVARYGGSVHQTAIQAYRIKGEILTWLQEDVPMVSALMPDAVGTPHELEAAVKGRIKRHGMEQVIGAIENQKSEDQKIIASATGKTCP